MTDAVPITEIRRGAFLESRHLGHVAIAGANGEVLAAAGDPGLVVLPRSSVKMIQALPFVESGAADDLAAERLALASASHRGSAGHVEAVKRWLSDIGVDEDALVCGPEIPRDDSERARLVRAGADPGRAHDNCSGKHCGFLAFARQLGASGDYADPAHPVQKAVREAMEDLTGDDGLGHATDGCSAPNFAATLGGLARAMALFAVADESRGAREKAQVRLVDAMRAHPALVDGEGGAVTGLIRATGGKAVVKNGAEGCWTAILPEAKLGVAIKAADGADRAAEAMMAAVLDALGAFPANHPMSEPSPIRDRNGAVVGEIRVDRQTVQALMKDLRG